jgi:hypothetical protein
VADCRKIGDLVFRALQLADDHELRLRVEVDWPDGRREVMRTLTPAERQGREKRRKQQERLARRVGNLAGEPEPRFARCEVNRHGLRVSAEPRAITDADVRKACPSLFKGD